MEERSQFQENKKRAWAEIDLSALNSNIHEILSMIGKERSLLAVVKANAYGHGIIRVAQASLDAGAKWLGVATVSEGIVLRAAGILAPIALLCAPTPADAREIVHFGLTPCIGDRDLLQAMSRAVEDAGRHSMKFVAPVHLEIDTGCGRSGFLPEEALSAWEEATNSGLIVDGISTHFADADGAEVDFTLEQWRLFTETRKKLESAGAKFEWSHAGNSAASLRIQTLDCNLTRPGLLIYGISPPIPNSNLKAPDIRPALSLRARVATVRNLPAGHNISYGLTHTLTRPSRIATVLIGYGDGYPRRLSNCGEMLIRGMRVPILGRVCMDQTMIDVTDLPNVRAGEIATCIGTDGQERISIQEIAKLIGTTDHEIPTTLTDRVERIYLD